MPSPDSTHGVLRSSYADNDPRTLVDPSGFFLGRPGPLFKTTIEKRLRTFESPRGFFSAVRWALRVRNGRWAFVAQVGAAALVRKRRTGTIPAQPREAAFGARPLGRASDATDHRACSELEATQRADLGAATRDIDAVAPGIRRPARAAKIRFNASRVYELRGVGHAHGSGVIEIRRAYHSRSERAESENFLMKKLGCRNGSLCRSDIARVTGWRGARPGFHSELALALASVRFGTFDAFPDRMRIGSQRRRTPWRCRRCPPSKPPRTQENRPMNGGRDPEWPASPAPSGAGTCAAGVPQPILRGGASNRNFDGFAFGYPFWIF